MSDLPNIALMMIVKNEVKTLPRLLESVRQVISSWRIIDTGSTDGTQQLIFDALADLPGELIEEPWVNFGVNRSSLVSRFPAGAEFALLLDADQILTVDSISELREELDASPEVDAFMVAVKETKLSYLMPYLVRNGKDYIYVGATHEYLTAKQNIKRAPIHSISIKHVGDGGSKSDKFERDVALLTQEIVSGADTPRNHFYLGQSFECLKRLPEAVKQYQIVSERSGWDEEKYIARLRLARISLGANQTQEALRFFLLAIDACPDRREARYEAAKIYAAAKQHAAALAILRDRDAFEQKQRILFLEPWLERWTYDNEIGVHLWRLGNIAAAKPIFEEILTRTDLPPEGKKLVEKNLGYC
jgi:tetratricopeptide (TPR) repeat protein